MPSTFQDKYFRIGQGISKHFREVREEGSKRGHEEGSSLPLAFVKSSCYFINLTVQAVIFRQPEFHPLNGTAHATVILHPKVFA